MENYKWPSSADNTADSEGGIFLLYPVLFKKAQG